MKLSKVLLFLFVLVVGASLVVAQPKKSRKELEQEREKRLKKINQTSKVLEETKAQKKSTIGQLNVLSQEIKQREELVQVISIEVNVLDNELNEQTQLIFALEEDLKALKEEYARMIYTNWKHMNGMDRIFYIFAADNFSQMVRRLSYFKQYVQARTYQLKEINEVAEALTVYRTQLAESKNVKTSLLNTQTIEAENLKSAKNQQSNVLKELSSKEKQLKEELKDNQKAAEKLNRLIEDLIAAERKKAMEEAKKSSSKTPTKISEANIKLSNSFEANKGKLPWPVQSGRVSQHFGRQAHPVLKGVFVDNLGVDILTVKSEQIKAVFNGKVITVAEVPGMHKIVMIQHGQYFTVYAKLKEVNVSVGQEVTTKQVIGTVYTDKDGSSELQFQVWQNEVKLNPESWLRPR